MVGTATLSYDANGNLTNDGTNIYTWDSRNHLTAISKGSTASFVYDALGRREQKTIAGMSTQFLYDKFNPVQELQNGSPNANVLTGLNIDEYFARLDSGGAMALLTDALGSTIGLVNTAGSLTTDYTYDPFGATVVAGAANGNSYQFTGRENDGTGWYFYRARYYSPTFQRFIAQDPIGFRGGESDLYGYVSDDPINRRDQDGKGPVLGIAVTGVCAAIWVHQQFSALFAVAQLAQQQQQQPPSQPVVAPNDEGGQCKNGQGGDDEWPDYNGLQQKLAPMQTVVQDHEADSVTGGATDTLCWALAGVAAVVPDPL